MKLVNHKIAVAPMLDWSDRHYRYFMRLITKYTALYTDMIVADAIIHGNRSQLLGYNIEEQPNLIVQLGGSNPDKLKMAAKICQEFGYNEINLNLGCPSERVQSGSFGACLMEEPILVKECIEAMYEVTSIPITVKHRTGINYNYDYDFLHKFVEVIAASNCKRFIVHARNAILKGLSPKQNREIPPLRYDYVYQLKQAYPNLDIIINGGIKTIDAINSHLQFTDGIMLGREAYHNPYLLAKFDSLYFNDSYTFRTRKEIALDMVSYLEKILSSGGKLHHVTRHMIGLYYGCKKAKIWRQTLTTKIIQTNNLNDYLELVNYMDE